MTRCEMLPSPSACLCCAVSWRRRRGKKQTERKGEKVAGRRGEDLIGEDSRWRTAQSCHTVFLSQCVDEDSACVCVISVLACD